MELVTARCRLRGLCRADRDQAVSLYTNAEVRRFLGAQCRPKKRRAG